jgi:glycine cleavage system H lipoate-binding protein
MLPELFDPLGDPVRTAFLGAFYVVASALGVTVGLALLRARRDLRAGQADAIRWREEFDELPESRRRCRHAASGRIPGRVCPNGFDCRRCETHEALLAGQPAAVADPGDGGDILGFDLPRERAYHRGHTWVEVLPDGTARVGLDNFGARLVGPPDDVTLPTPGSVLHANGQAWRMRRGSAQARILSPLDGKVVETGGAERGWYLRLAPLGEGWDLRHLLRDGEVRPWMLHEIESLQSRLNGAVAGATLADGGTPMADFPQACPQADWEGIWREAFLDP